MKPRRSTRGPRPQLLLALWGAGMILFNFPMLVVFDRDATVLGAPLLPVALFAIWGVLIAALAVAMERGAARPGPGEGEEGPASPAPKPPARRDP